MPEAPIGLRRLPGWGQLGSKARSLVTRRHRLGAAPLWAPWLAALAPAALLLAAGLHTALVGRLQRHPLLVCEQSRQDDSFPTDPTARPLLTEPVESAPVTRRR
jgi:hypothetical protein